MLSLLLSCTEHPGAEDSVCVFLQENPGVGKAATDPAAGLCHLRVAWVQSGKVNDRQRRMTRNQPINPKVTFLVEVVARITGNRTHVISLERHVHAY